MYVIGIVWELWFGQLGGNETLDKHSSAVSLPVVAISHLANLPTIGSCHSGHHGSEIGATEAASWSSNRMEYTKKLFG